MGLVAVISKPENDRPLRSSPYRIVMAPVEKPATGRKSLGGSFDIEMDSLTLLPGVNFVEKALIDRAKSHPLIAPRFTRKVFDVRVPLAEHLETAQGNIHEYNAEDAEDIIKECLDEDLLKKWMVQHPGKDIENWCRDRLSQLKEEAGDGGSLMEEL